VAFFWFALRARTSSLVGKDEEKSLANYSQTRQTYQHGWLLFYDTFLPRIDSPRVERGVLEMELGWASGPRCKKTVRARASFRGDSE
jgi:hypothetical protein